MAQHHTHGERTSVGDKSAKGDGEQHSVNGNVGVHDAVHQTWGAPSSRPCPPPSNDCGNPPGDLNNGQHTDQQHKHRWPEIVQYPVATKFVAVDASPRAEVRTSSFASPGQFIPSETRPGNPPVQLPSG